MKRDYLFSGFLSKLTWQMAATLTYVIVTFLQSVMIANSLGLRDFGTWSSIVGFTVIVSQLVDPRYLDFLLKFLTKIYINKKDFLAKQLVYICLLLSLFLLLIVILSSLFLVPIISDYFSLQKDNLELILVLAVISTFSHTHFLTIFQAFLRVKGMVKELSIICIILYLFRYISILIALKLFDPSILGISISFALVNVIFMIFFLFFIRRRLSGKSFIKNMRMKSMKENYEGASSMLRRLHLTSVSSIPQKELDISILTVFSSPESIGIYRVAKNFVVALWSFVDGINLVIFPQITELYLRDNFKELRKLIIKISLSCLLLAIVVIIAAYSLLPFLIEIIFIEDFTDAHGLSMIMFLGSLFWLPLIWVYPLAISAEKTKLILFSTLTTGCILTILYVLSIQTFDIRGVSIVYGLAPGMLSTILLIGLLLDSKHRSNYR